MNTFMISFLSVSVSGLCMAGIVVLLEKLLKNHLSFRFRYGLWLFVILRLLIPVSPVAGVVGTLFSEETWNPQPQTQLAAKASGTEGPKRSGSGYPNQINTGAIPINLAV